MPALNILIVDSRISFSKAARQYLLRKKNIDQIEVSAEPLEALTLARKLKPDLILVELEQLKNVEPFFCQQLKAEAPGAIVVGLTLFNSSLFYSNPFKDQGLDSVVSREDFADSILQVIRSIYDEQLA